MDRRVRKGNIITEASGTRRMEVTRRFTVQTYDIDFAGIVSNIVYIRWLEDLRLAMLDAHLPLKELIAEGITPVLLRTDVHYLRAIRLFEEPVGRMWLGEVGKVRWTLQAEFVVDGDMAAHANQVCAAVNLATLRPVRTPARLRGPTS